MISLLQDCVFVKKSSDTVLKVEFDGDFRVAFCKRCCKRWYFTFNGIECAKPAPIEGIDAIWENHGRTDTNVHKHSQIGGYYEGIGSGTVRVEWQLVIVQDSEKVLTPTPGTSLSHES